MYHISTYSYKEQHKNTHTENVLLTWVAELIGFAGVSLLRHRVHGDIFIHRTRYKHTENIRTHRKNVALTWVAELIGFAGVSLLRHRVHGDSHRQVVENEVDAVLFLGHECEGLDLLAVIFRAAQDLAALFVCECACVYMCVCIPLL
jgi:hypothetical protein